MKNGSKPSRERVHGAPEREVSAGAQQPMRFAIADLRIDPGPCGRRVHKVKPTGPRVPVLERGTVNLGRESIEVVSCERCQVLAELDAHDPKPPLQQRQGRHARPAPDLQEPIARRQLGDLDQIVKQLTWIPRPRLLIERGSGIERLAQRLPRLARLRRRLARVTGLAHRARHSASRAISPHPPSPLRRFNAVVVHCGSTRCRCDGAGLSCALRESNPRALPSRRQRAGFPACNFWAVAALAFAISYVTTDSRY